MKDWFEDWFDSAWYHQLYENRDEQEAENFMLKINNEIFAKKPLHILDLACGKGRHALFLNQMGHKVTGIDLSENSINSAKKHENKQLKYYTGDIRKPFGRHRFDLVVNLFTSFGYFDNPQDDYAVLNNIHQALKTNGHLLIDFLNAPKVITSIIPEETKIFPDHRYNIKKYIHDGFVFKTITVIKKDKTLGNFTEKVKLIDLAMWENMLQDNGFCILKTFGDYQLNPYDTTKSPRLILWVKKI